MSFIESLSSALTLEASLCETKSTSEPEWRTMLLTSFSELSGSMGMAILPKATALKKATDQFGML